MADSLTITDNRNQKQHELPIENNCIWANDLQRIKDGEKGLMSYDPALLNTAACKSAITFIDGDKGILRYRGYPIEELAEKKSYLEVAYLILQGELPTAEQKSEWEEEIKRHLNVSSSINNMICALPQNSHPMSLFTTALASISCLNSDARRVSEVESRQLQIVRLIAKVTTLAAWGYRHKMGLPAILPNRDLSYTGNFLWMMFKDPEKDYVPQPAIEKALDILFTLHADHEQNCSTTAMRVIGSSLADPYLATAGAAAALSGPRHGGANEEVLMMLRAIGSKNKVAEHIKKVKEGDERLMGFGHRIYKNYDPRAKLIKKAAEDVFKVTGMNPLLEIAVELERIALEDEYFIKRKLYPNVDFYSGLIYEAMQIPSDMFTVLFAIARTSGWLAQWVEFLRDGEQKISRPRQIYIGRGIRHVPD